MATITDPHPLGVYPLPTRHLPASDSIKLPHIFVSHSDLPRREDGAAVISVQGDGIHVVDLSALHSVASYTLGPSVFYAAPAVSRVDTISGEPMRTTYAVIESTPETKKEQQGKLLWTWRGAASGVASGTSLRKHELILSETVHSIHPLQSIPSHVVLISPSGGICLMSTSESGDTSTIATLPASGATLIKTSLFGPSNTSFAKAAETLVCILHQHGSVYARFYALEQDSITRLGETMLGVFPVKDIAAVSCSSSGAMSLLLQSGKWSHHLITTQAPSSFYKIESSTSPITLSIPPKTPSGAHSVYALNSSLVLLCTINLSTNPPTLRTQIWDLQYSIVLATHILNLPATLIPHTPASNSNLKLQLAGATSSQILLAVMPHEFGISTQSSEPRKSAIFVIPFLVPSSSTISHAIGRAHETTKWLVSLPASEAPALSPNLSEQQVTLLDKMKTMIATSHPEGARKAYIQWTAHVPKKLPAPGKLPTASGEFSYEFVSKVLDLAINIPEKLKSPVHRRNLVQIVADLLTRRVVSNDMMKNEGGLIGALRGVGEWPSIQLAVKTILDIPEDEIIRCLKEVITSHRSTNHDSQHDDEAMKVDTVQDRSIIANSEAGIPPLKDFLADVLRCNFSPPALRAAIRDHLTDVEDVQCLLEVIEEWLAAWCDQELELASSPDGQPEQEVQLPPLSTILGLLQVVLDATFLKLIQYSPSHGVLKRLCAHVDPQLSLNNALETLRGPLEPFAVLKRQGKSKKAKKKGGPFTGLYRRELLTL